MNFNPPEEEFKETLENILMMIVNEWIEKERIDSTEAFRSAMEEDGVTKTPMPNEIIEKSREFQ